MCAGAGVLDWKRRIECVINGRGQLKRDAGSLGSTAPCPGDDGVSRVRVVCVMDRHDDRRHPVLTIPSAVRPCVGNAVISVWQLASVCYLWGLVVAHGTSRGTHQGATTSTSACHTC